MGNGIYLIDPVENRWKIGYLGRDSSLWPAIRLTLRKARYATEFVSEKKVILQYRKG